MAPQLAVPLAITAAGAAGSLFGRKKVQPIDISQQLSQLQGGIGQQRVRSDALQGALQPLTDQYKADTASAIGTARQGLESERSRYLTENQDLTNQAKDALRANLYSQTFSGLPDTLRAVREASAAGGGLNTGSYQQAVKETGIDTARKVVEGERDIQAQGLQNQQTAQQTAYQTFSALSSKLDDQQLDLLTKALDTGREDLVRNYATQMGLDEQETQGVIDLLNFQASGKMASDSADAQSRQSLYNALIGGGSTLLGQQLGK